MRVRPFNLVAMVLAFAMPIEQSRASSIMCDPAWLMGGVMTYQEMLTAMRQIAEYNIDYVGDGAEARVCPKLDTFRLYVRAGCISKGALPEIEAAFEPYDCG